MLTSLWHRTVSSIHNEDRAVHLRRTGDHVLNIVSVAWAVDVCIVTVCSFIFDVCGRNGDAALALFRRLVDVGEINSSTAIGFCHDLGDRCSQRGLAVVNVTDGTNVAMRFRPLKFSFCHFLKPSFD